MGILALDRRIDAEVLDARGGLSVITGGQMLRGTLRDVPQLFVAGAHVSIALSVGTDRFDALCRVLDEAVVFTPGSKLQLEVLKASPADVSGIEPFDLVPRTPPGGVPPPVGPVTLEDQAPEDDEPTGVVGTLKEMPVAEIVQALNQGAKDAIVEVRPKKQEGGAIGIERGRVTFAQHGELVGEPAFFSLFQASRGAFRIRYGRKPTEQNIRRDTVFLLLEGARILDEQMSGKHFAPSREGPSFVDEPPVLEAFEAGVTLVDHVLDDPPAPIDANDAVDVDVTQVRGPARLDSSGPFTRFFDEAGVHTPPPLPQETLRFQSLKLPAILEEDDLDRVDTDRTMRERKRLITEPPR